MLRLNLLRLLQHNAADQGACKQPRLAAPRSGGRKSEIRVPAQLDRGSPGPQVSRRSSQGRRACSLTALIPFRRAPPSRPDRPPKAPPPHSITWEVRLSAGESGQGHAQTAAGSVKAECAVIVQGVRRVRSALQCDCPDIFPCRAHLCLWIVSQGNSDGIYSAVSLTLNQC